MESTIAISSDGGGGDCKLGRAALHTTSVLKEEIVYSYREGVKVDEQYNRSRAAPNSGPEHEHEAAVI